MPRRSWSWQRRRRRTYVWGAGCKLSTALPHFLVGLQPFPMPWGHSKVPVRLRVLPVKLCGCLGAENGPVKDASGGQSRAASSPSDAGYGVHVSPGSSESRLGWRSRAPRRSRRRGEPSSPCGRWLMGSESTAQPGYCCPLFPGKQWCGRCRVSPSGRSPAITRHEAPLITCQDLAVLAGLRCLRVQCQSDAAHPAVEKAGTVLSQRARG